MTRGSTNSSTNGRQFPTKETLQQMFTEREETLVWRDDGEHATVITLLLSSDVAIFIK
jgi:hypothetical protein